jgi:hypothetical protein
MKASADSAKLGAWSTPVLIAAGSCVTWTLGDIDYFDSARPAWLLLVSSALASSILLGVLLRLGAVKGRVGVLATLWAGSFWCLGLPGLPYWGYLVGIPLDLLLAGLVVSFWSSWTVPRCLGLVALVRWPILVVLAQL